MFRKNGYIFTNKRHPLKGIMATLLGIISLATLGYEIFMSYKFDGDVPMQYGAAALLATVFALAGAALGVVSKAEKDRYYFFSYMGIVLNVLALAVVSAVLYAGAYGIG